MLKVIATLRSEWVNAENNFIDTLVSVGGISHSDAVKVFNLYRKIKAVKLDPVGGRYSVKHGGYLDRETIKRALEQA